jgi:hypothetical protein
MYALVSDGKFIKWIDLTTDYPNISFPQLPKSTDLPEGVVFVNKTNPPDILFEQGYGAPYARLTNNGWEYTYTIIDLPQSEKLRKLKSISDSVKQERDSLLFETDWTQGRDILDSVALKWQPYRQALRDITAQSDFPLNVVWPSKPE